MTDPTPTRDEAVRKLMAELQYRQAVDMVNRMTDAEMAAVLSEMVEQITEQAKEIVQLRASTPAPASGGVHAVREALLGYVLKPGQYETASVFARGQNRVAVDMLGVLDEASLSPAATPVSEAGGDDWVQRQKDRKQREVEILQEYRWGNLTPLGVANHLKRAGFNIDYAIKVSNALAKPASSPAGVYVVQTLIDKTEKLIEAAEYGPYTPKPSPWWHPNLADAHSKNPPEA